MGQQRCPGCFGSGDYYSSDRNRYVTCGFCGGIGTIYRADPVPTPQPDRQPPSTVRSAPQVDFEDALANLLGFAMWGLVAYCGITLWAWEWYWAVIAGGLFGVLMQKLFAGPLRILSTLVKYLLIIALLLGAVFWIAQLLDKAS